MKSEKANSEVSCPRNFRVNLALKLSILILMSASANSDNTFQSEIPEVKDPPISTFKQTHQEERDKRTPNKRDYDSILVSGIHPLYISIKPQYLLQGRVRIGEATRLAAGTDGIVKTINNKALTDRVITAGELIFTIDDGDAKRKILLAKERLNEAQANLEIQKGQQQLAKIGLKQSQLANMLSESNATNLSLVLREPQMAIAQARFKIEKINLEQAEFELQRTEIKAPYDAIVTQLDIGRGSFVSAQKEVGQIINANFLFVDAQLPRNLLEKIDFEGLASIEIVDSQSSGRKPKRIEGVIVSARPTLDIDTHQVVLRIRIETHKVKSFKKKPFLINDLVYVNLLGNKIDNVLKLPKSSLVNGDSILTVKSNLKISLRRVEIKHIDDHFVYVYVKTEKGEIILTKNVKYVKPKGKLQYPLEILEDLNDISTNQE